MAKNYPTEMEVLTFRVAKSFKSISENFTKMEKRLEKYETLFQKVIGFEERMCSLEKVKGFEERQNMDSFHDLHFHNTQYLINEIENLKLKQIKNNMNM